MRSRHNSAIVEIADARWRFMDVNRRPCRYHKGPVIDRDGAYLSCRCFRGLSMGESEVADLARFRALAMKVAADVKYHLANRRIMRCVGLGRLLMGACCWATPASPATVSVSTTVNADVVPACYFDSNPDIDFGSLSRTIGSSISVAQAQVQGSVSISCTTGYAYNLYSNTGANAAGSQRRLINSSYASYLNYNISPVGFGGADFPTNSSSALGFQGTGSYNPISLYVQIPAQTLTGTQKPGYFSDQIMFTAVF